MENQIINLKKFPTTRYQGSKRKIIPWLYNNIKDLEFDTVLDAFGGSASVSFLFKKMGKSVTYNDNLRFNYLIGKAIIENSNEILNDSDLAFLIKTNSDSGYKIVQEIFDEIYYYPKENKWIDNKIAAIQSMNTYPNDILEFKKSLAYYALFQSCLIKRPFNLFHRKNLNLRKNKVERSFGNYKTWNRRFDTYFKRFAYEANDLIFDNGKLCIASNESVFTMKNFDYDLVYLDPPYFRKNFDNETSYYSETYHFLEGLANYNDWKELIDGSTINKRFKSHINFNNFGSKNIISSFEDIFDRYRKSKIVLSYKKGGVPSIETLVKLLKKFKNEVYTRSIHYKYALNRQNGDSLINREVLIIAI